MKLKFRASKALIKAVVSYFSQDKRFKITSIAKDNNSYSIEVVDLGDGTDLYSIPVINIHIMHGQLSSFVRSFVCNEVMISQLQEEIESSIDQINAGNYDLLPEFANYCFVYAQQLKKYRDKQTFRNSYPTYGKLKLRTK